MQTFNPESLNIDPSTIPAVLRPIVKTGVTVLTCFYPTLAIPMAMIGGIWAEAKQHNTQKMLAELQQKYEELSAQNLISQDFLESDSYTSLMIDILRKVHAFNTEQKRLSVAGIYKAVLQDKLNYDESEEKIFIDALEKITSQEIVILNFIDKNQAKLGTIGSWKNFHQLYQEQNKEHPLEKYKFKYFSTRLEQMGLAFCSDIDGYDNNSVYLVSHESKKSSAGLTPMGLRFIKYLQNDINEKKCPKE